MSAIELLLHEFVLNEGRASESVPDGWYALHELNTELRSQALKIPVVRLVDDLRKSNPSARSMADLRYWIGDKAEATVSSGVVVCVTNGSVTGWAARRGYHSGSDPSRRGARMLIDYGRHRD